jgi:myosin V
LNDEATLGLIRSLKVPQPSSQNPVSEREVLFPAHLINLITSQMWRYGYVKESERFLANVMQGIQQQVMVISNPILLIQSLEGEDAINPGVFWLSNVQEMLSFVCVAESELLAPVATSEMDDLEWQEYDRLVSIVKHDLESLQFNIYHTWMKQLKTRLHKMIIPAIIESQSLPGFITNDGNRFLNKLLQSSSGPQFSMDDLINLLNKVYKAMKAYYLEESIIQQAAQALLKLVGVTAFNDLLMRFIHLLYC